MTRKVVELMVASFPYFCGKNKSKNYRIEEVKRLYLPKRLLVWTELHIYTMRQRIRLLVLENLKRLPQHYQLQNMSWRIYFGITKQQAVIPTNIRRFLMIVCVHWFRCQCMPYRMNVIDLIRKRLRYLQVTMNCLPKIISWQICCSYYIYHPKRDWFYLQQLNCSSCCWCKQEQMTYLSQTSNS